MRVGIIGCGNIGKKRAAALTSTDQLVAIAESNRDAWTELTQKFKTEITYDAGYIINHPTIDAVIIATPPHNHTELIQACLENNKHVLCEKPIGHSTEEIEPLIRLSQERKRVLKCGFNLRHDAGLNRAAELVKQGAIGDPYFFKCNYVNGCALVNTNGVGALLDMGTHVIDLIHWFVGNPENVTGHMQKAEFSKDDNCMFSFQHKNIIGQAHCSLIRWRNHFDLEISGSEGSIEIHNLPKWGKQEVRIGQRVRPSGIPLMKSEFFEGDLSWANEWTAFEHLCSNNDLTWNTHALQVMQTVNLIQNNSRRTYVS